MDDGSTTATVKSPLTASNVIPSAGRADARANRQRVLEAAREVFAEQGLAAEIKDIADRAGVGVATIYRGFGSKNDLLVATAKEAGDRMTEILEKSVDTADPVEGLRVFLLASIDFVDNYGWLVQACLADETLMALMPKKTNKGRRLDDLRGLVQHGVDSGAFTPGLPIDVAVMLIKGAVLSMSLAPKHEPKLPPGQIVDGIIELLRGRGD